MYHSDDECSLCSEDCICSDLEDFDWIAPISLPIRLENIILPTYNIVDECEREVLSISYDREPQSFFFEGEEQFYTNLFEYPEQFYNNIKDSVISGYSQMSFMTRFFYRQTIIDFNYITKLLLDICYLIYFLSIKQCKKHYMMCFANFASLRLGDKSLVTTISSEVKEYYNLFKDYIDFNHEEIPTSLSPQSENFSNFFEMYKQVRQTKILKKMKKAIITLLSLNFFKPLGLDVTSIGYTKLEKQAMEMKASWSEDTIFSILEAFHFITQRIWQCISNQSMDPLFSTGTIYDKFYSMYTDVKFKYTIFQNPHLKEQERLSDSEFLDLLNKSIEMGQNIKKHFQKDHFSIDVKVVSAHLSELLLIKNDIVNLEYTRSERRAPFAMLLYGDSGIGKTTLQNILMDYFGKIQNLPLGDLYKYVKNPAAKFYDGFRSPMWCVVIDDIGYMAPKAVQGVDPTLEQMIQINNSVVFMPDQAALEDKGKHPMRCELLIGSTNTEHMNVLSYFSCPSAIQRRMPYILDVEVKDEFKDDRGMLDSSKCVTQSGNYPDYWLWTVKKILPQSVREPQRTLARSEIILHRVGMKDFLKWYASAISHHVKCQKITQDSVNSLKQVEICDQCQAPQSFCECMKAQSQLIKDAFYTKPMDLSLWRIILLSILNWYVTNVYFKKPNRHNGVNRMINYFDYALAINNSILLFSLFTGLIYLGNFSTFIFVYSVLHWFYLKNYIRSILTTILISRRQEYWTEIKKRSLRLQEYSQPKFIGTLLLTLTSIMFVYKVFFKKPSTQVQANGSNLSKVDGSNQSEVDVNEGQAPIVKDGDRENVWYKNEYVLNSFDIGKTSPAWLNMDRKEIIEKISRNCIHVRFDIDESYARFRMFCIGSDLYVCNKHSLRGFFNFNLQVIQNRSVEGISQNTIVNVSRSDILIKDKSDLCFIRLRGLPPKKDLSGLLLQAHIEPKFDGVYLDRKMDGVVDCTQVKKIRFTPNVESIALPNERFNLYRGETRNGGYPGMCGSVLVGFSPQGPIIMGIHTFGAVNNPTVEAMGFTFKEFSEAKEHFKFYVDEGICELGAQSAPVDLLDLSKKAECRYISSGVASVYGSLSIPRASGKSRVEKTIMHSLLRDYGYTEKYTKPDLVSWVPYHLALKDMVQPAAGYSNTVLDKCVHSYLNKILREIPIKTLKDELIVYDEFTAVNGAAGVTFVDKMNRNSSMGHPYNRSKKLYLEHIDSVGELTDPVQFNNEVREEIKRLETNYRTGHRNNVIFRANLKDEPVSFEKAKLSKTRVFAGAPASWTVVTRKYLLSFIRLMQLNPFTFECAIGASAQSRFWEDTYKHMTRHGVDRMIAGDFSKFDKKMSAKIILAAFSVIKSLYQVAGNYSEQDLQVIDGIASDVAFNWMNFNGTLMSFFANNPSGQPLTVNINSIVNALYMRIAFCEASGLDVNDFDKYVTLLTYGDDNFMNVSPDCHTFDHTVIQSVMAKYNIGYTMADKTSASVPFIHIDNVSFLKRTFRYDEHLQHWVAPLEHDSIEKMMMTWVRSKTISPEEQAVAVLSSAHMEYFWYGLKVFEEKNKLINKIIEDLDLTIYLDNPLPSYTDYAARFLKTFN